MDIINKGQSTLNLSDVVIVQNGRQYNSVINTDADYYVLPNSILPGTFSGVISFPAIDINDFKLVFDIFSNDFNEKTVIEVKKDN